MTRTFDGVSTVEIADLHKLMSGRFGDTERWAFVCPACGDVASVTDFEAALDNHPRVGLDGHTVTARELAGQECIGRTLGALARDYAGRGCDWVAYGLFAGPLFVKVPDGTVIPSFEPAPAEVPG